MPQARANRLPLYLFRAVERSHPCLAFLRGRMYRNILFDFDGTLVPSLDLWLKAFHYALGQMGRELPDRTIIEKFYFRDWDEISDEFALPSGEQLRTHVFDGLTIFFQQATTYDGAVDLISDLRRQGIRTGIVTTSPRLQIVTVLERLGIDALFDTVVTGDDVTRWKPDPEPVLLAITNLG